ncbi:hypothetical protein BS17DRAFT_153117 [Gyrodon lividus]|nr:hypothetical protein BS17DRAFT_153117 [Gyrodon lividus]
MTVYNASAQTLIEIDHNRYSVRQLTMPSALNTPTILASASKGSYNTSWQLPSSPLGPSTPSNDHDIGPRLVEWLSSNEPDTCLGTLKAMERLLKDETVSRRIFPTILSVRKEDKKPSCSSTHAKMIFISCSR